LHARAERDDHVLWRFPLKGGSDLCADPLADGSVVCSDNGTIYFVGKDGRELARFEAYKSAADSYYSQSPEGYQWVGCPYPAKEGHGSLLFVTTTRPPMNQLKLLAVNRMGDIRWSAVLSADRVSTWIGFSKDSVYVGLYDQQGAQSGGKMLSTVQRYTLDGKPVYSVDIPQWLGDMRITPDNYVYLVNNTQQYSYGKPTAAKPVIMLGPDGKQRWTSSSYGTVGVYPNFGGDGTLYFLDQAGVLHGMGRDGKQKFATSLGANFTTMGGYTPSWRDAFGIGRRGSSFYNSYANAGTATVADGGQRVYCIDSTSLYAVDLGGKKVWTKKTPGQPYAVAAARDGTAYVAMYSAGVVAYGPDGREKWRNESIVNIASAMSVAADGRMFIEADGELICFKP
jgi:hypothetical protein